MSELDQAQAHLRKAQDVLHLARLGKGSRFVLASEISVSQGFLRTCEATVLSALSWVWDAQERQPKWGTALPECLKAVLDPEIELMLREVEKV